mgnify:CR=1 FL=1
MFGFGSMLKDYLEYHKISQSDFAQRLGVTKKHINNILNENADISEELMIAISLITDIDIKLIALVENKKKLYNYLNKKFKNEKEINSFLSSFYIKEMQKKNWLTLNDETSYLQNAYDLLKYLNVRDFNIFDKYSKEKIFFKKYESTNLKKVFLWIRRCDDIIEYQNPSDYSPSNLNRLLDELIKERNKPFNKKSLIKLFNKYGLYLVIEEALDGTKVRGCTKVIGNNPAIYMTCYLKEKSSFYFALYHEIGHVKSDYNKAKSKIIIDGDDNLEKRADLFAINKMIDQETYKLILNNLKNKDKICKEKNIPLCFLYSRLAHDGIIKYSDKDYIKNREKISYDN